ncbi:tRNA 5-hydroxyuridine methyltransferase [Paraburkholderia kirstenboschensis]|uniref:O-methyltransferase n=1 Tax=Paraburkholderia kirstenboschensis TaxID=1245436 RepID=UPI000AB623E0|nr:hypothetical protein [Paraburkholderia kirstenboschensis]CAD6556838.1 tRNA 5-hydroxyuridine methyltransferase [Paraburkholderia kirstenboschensis]
MVKDEASELLQAVEEALVRHRAFGESAYILEQLQVAYKRRLDRVATQLPIARQLLDAFGHAGQETRYRIVGNTVVRCAVQHAHLHLETDTSYGLSLLECERVFETTLRHLQQRKIGTPFENSSTTLDRLGPESYHGWVWREDYPDDLLGCAFRTILEQEYGESLCSLSGDELAMLRKGEHLLQELLPTLTPSALGHAHLIGCFDDVGFWKGKVSSSQIRMGGTIFLNRQILRNPWCVAEHLLHEALHQKLYDFRHGHSLLDPDFSGEDAPKVCSLWNAEELNKANHWDTHRTFAAFHVYVHLSLLASQAERRAEALEPTYGPFKGLIDSRKALERARYLGEQLSESCSRELGIAGKRMLDWLMSVLGFLDPAPPPKGAYIHLVLDRYQREANRVESVFLESEVARASLARRLVSAVSAEVDDARRVIAALTTEGELERFNRAVAEYSGDGLALQFPAVRRLIAKTILDLSPTGYSLASRANNGTDPDDLVKQLVEAGSYRLYLIQANVPPAVAGAKRRAKDQRFTKSCDDNVGRLLAVLAAAVPVGGRILEIGTGVGVGLGWIISGLGGRNDVDVVSIEGDRRLSNAASGWQWPAGVHILTADAAEAVATIGTFDLIFADAAPIKYGNIESVLKTMRPSAVLIIDDLYSGPSTSEQQRAEKNALRHLLSNSGELQVVELEWASGVILATMMCIPHGQVAPGGANVVH